MKFLPEPNQAPLPSADWRTTVRTGALVVVFTFVGLGGWSAMAGLNGGVVAQGALETSGSRKTIQHLEGGIVREILVRDGSKVEEGELLVSLDPTRNAATNQNSRQQMAIALAMEARLLAQRDMKDRVEFPAEVTELQNDPLIETSMTDNRRQFDSRLNSMKSAVGVLEAQLGQAQKEIDGARNIANTAEQQLASVDKELPVLQNLMKRGLVPVPRVTALERQKMQIQGQLDAGRIQAEEAENKVAEIKARIGQLNQEYRQEAANALPDIRATLGELRQKVVISGDALKRGEIRAPVAGTVQGLKVFTIGGVVRPGEPVLDIAPDSDMLVVRAKVSPLDIDRVQMGAVVDVRLPQFIHYQTERIMGAVSSVSRDSLEDPVTGNTYYAVEASIDRSTVDPAVNEKLLAGMTVSIVIRTGERTVLSYLVAPMMNRFSTAMRER
jgi:HlyD family type I secretion membrane fusion protein